MACKYTYKGITYNSKEEFISQVIKPTFLSKPDVILPIGTSGSGKSTFIKSLPQENLVVIEPDAMRVEFTGDMNDKSKDKEIYIEAANRAITAIKQGKQVVFDTTNLTKDKRLPFIEAIKKAIPTANIQYKLMELNPELAKQRIKDDIAAGKNRANVPDATIDRHAESYKQMLEDIKSEPITPFVNKTDTKTRRILEVQSDLFQKGRDKQILERSGLENIHIYDKEVDGDLYYINFNSETNTLEYIRRLYNDINFNTVISKKEFENATNQKIPTLKVKNSFLQLLNKDNNWVTFFIKSIIQDTAEKGYEKVLFPTGNTASKVEGHTTLEEFKKQKEDRIKELELQKSTAGVKFDNRTNNYALGFRDNTGSKVREFSENELELKNQLPLLIDSFDNEIQQLKQELERVETEGFGALKPVYNFYETTVTNVLKKQGYQPILITDEYGNTWNEVTINQARDLSEILLQRDKVNKIIGQANIKAMTVLIDAINQRQDTLPHEYAHHYIAWFRNTPIVQEAIKKWGSEEALVQSIGEQVVKQKGEAYNWWNKFVKWILDKFNSLSKLDKQELTQILTDAFLTRQDLSIQPTVSAQTAEQIYSQLGSKTQSENVKIAGKDELSNVKYDPKTFWSKVVPEAKGQFGNKIIVAYRGNRNNTFEKNYKESSTGVTIGNPFDFADETGTREEQGIKSTKKFIHWMVTGDNMGNKQATPEYREAIINDIKNGKLKNRNIIYYQEKGYATHATALDYLINKYDWSKSTTQPTVESIPDVLTNNWTTVKNNCPKL